MADVGLADIDLTDLDNFAQGFPHHLFEVHRREAPVWWHAPTEHTPDGEGFWSVATHAETLEVLQNPTVFSSETGGSRRLGGTALQDTDLAGVALNMMDGPRHDDIRRVLHPSLTRRGVARLESDLRRRARGLLAAIEDGVPVDFVAISTEVPLQTICVLLGIPEDDRHQLWDLVDSQLDVPSDDRVSTARQPAKQRMLDYGRALLASKRAQPADDLLSTVVHAVLPDRERPTLSDAEAYCLLRGLFGAGWETTRAATATGLLALGQHPGQLEAVRSDPALMTSAIEEILRWSTPSPSKRRTVTQPTELGGHRLAPGDKVLVWEASANRDQRVFEDADRFDIRRDPNPHLAFGSGAHFCPGAHLARLEMRVMYEELLGAFRRIEVVGPVEWTRGNRHTGPRHLWVRVHR
jgi:cytochrome P450